MKIKRKTMNKIHNEMVRRFTPYWDRKNQDIHQLQSTVVELQKAVRELQAQPKHRAETPVMIEKKSVEPTASRDVVELTWIGIGRHDRGLFFLNNAQHQELTDLGVVMAYEGTSREQETHGYLRGFRIEPTIVPRKTAFQFMSKASRVLRGQVMFDRKMVS